MVAHIVIREDLALTYRIINHPECWQGYSCNPTLYSLFFQDNNMAHPPILVYAAQGATNSLGRFFYAKNRR